MSTALESPRSAAPASATRAWHRLWWKPALIALFLSFCYYDVVAKLVHDWWFDPDASHGFIVPLFAGYLIWQQRHKLAAMPARPSWVGLLIISAALGTLVIGVLGAELFLSRCSLVLALGGLVVYFFGWQFFRAVAFPWIFLFFMIPPPAIIFNQITFSLQILASQLAKESLTFVGVPVLLEGNVLKLPAMPLEVADACSGIRSLISLGVVSIIYGYLAESRNTIRVALAAASIPLAVSANAARIMGTGIMVQYWDPDKALGFFHTFSGWVVFMIAMALLLGAHGLLRTVADAAGRRVQWAS